MIGICDVGSGNIQSVAHAVYEQGFDFLIINDEEQIAEVSHLILPGVGNFGKVMQLLAEQNLIQAIKNHTLMQKKPLLGICLGMQLLYQYSEEGNCKGLGLISGTVKKLDINKSLRVPHVGWNNIQTINSHPLLESVPKDSDFYYVHSYGAQNEHQNNVIATTSYGDDFIAMTALDNIFGTQFHPEKSQKNGLKIIENFCHWDGQWRA